MDQHVRLLSEQPLYTLVSLPIELLVYVFSFVSSVRDRVKLRYVSQRIRAAVETPSLWRVIFWPHLDFREEHLINGVLKSCGRYMKQLSFPDLMVPVNMLGHCRNLVRLSLPSAQPSLNQLMVVVQSMRNLQYLDILWSKKNDIEQLLLIAGHNQQAVNGNTVKELTIREQVQEGLLFTEAIHRLLNQWMACNLIPHTLNIVSKYLKVIDEAVDTWIPLRSQAVNHTGYFKVYYNFKNIIGLAPTFPDIQLHFIGHYYIESNVTASNYGLLGLDHYILALTDRTMSVDNVVHRAMMLKSCNCDTLNGTITNIGFLTHFSASLCGLFHPGHLEQLAIACPNLQRLNLSQNVNCLKRLQGLRAIATGCKRLSGLNILGISVENVECCVQLWEILIDLQLTILAIDLCCLQCFEDDQTKQIIISLHKKCFKIKALESYSRSYCPKCVENNQPLQLSNFPSLIYCVTNGIDLINICEKLRYLWYRGDSISCSWSKANCNLQQLYIESEQLNLDEMLMDTISAHGGLVHVILSTRFIPLVGIYALIENSPNLITCHINVITGVSASNRFCLRYFRSRLEEKFSHRKLISCGSYHILRGYIHEDDIDNLFRMDSMDFFPLWCYCSMV